MEQQDTRYLYPSDIKRKVQKMTSEQAEDHLGTVRRQRIKIEEEAFINRCWILELEARIGGAEKRK